MTVDWLREGNGCGLLYYSAGQKWFYACGVRLHAVILHNTDPLTSLTAPLSIPASLPNREQQCKECLFIFEMTN